MPKENYDLLPLKWDSDYFDVSSARVNLHGIIDEKNQEKIIEFSNQFDFVTISNIDNRKENNHWVGERTNAFLADVNIQFEKLLIDKPNDQNGNTHVLNNLNRNQQILDIAKKSFNHSRFFNDWNLPKKKAAKIYCHWTESSFEQSNKYFVISERGNNIAGYILFSFHKDSCVIELIAVDEKFQGQRVGKSLIHTMETFVMNKGVKTVKVGTQVNNISAVQFYNAMDFKYTSCGSIYHLWKK